MPDGQQTGAGTVPTELFSKTQREGSEATIESNFRRLRAIGWYMEHLSDAYFASKLDGCQLRLALFAEDRLKSAAETHSLSPILGLGQPSTL